jgi:hypothetical protein
MTKGALVHADFAHDKLNIGRPKGRPRECDFALIARHDPSAPKCNAEVVVETKWAGSTHCNPKQICNDFLRLAVIKHAEPGTFCVFVLAGFHSDMAKCLKGAPFRLPGRRKKGIGASGRKKKLVLSDLNLSQRESFSVPMHALSKAGASIPNSFVCQSHGLHPVQSQKGTVKFQAIAWEIVETSTDAMPARGRSS